MENYELTTVSKHKFSCSFPSTPKHCLLVENTFYYVQNASLICYELANGALEVLPFPEDYEEIIALHYVAVSLTLFLVTRNYVGVYKIGEEQIQVFKPQKPVSAIAWHPEELFVVVVHSDGILSKYFVSGIDWSEETSADLIQEVPGGVTVGWGSESTQFQGKAGKKKQEEKQETKDEVPFSNPHISFRGNGDLFAVNFWIRGQRRVKVFDGTLKALYESEQYKGLLDLVTFRQVGNMIATVAATGVEQHEVVVFEKNCKVRFTFPIHEVLGTVRRLYFHPHLPLLAVLSGSSENDAVSFYHQSNAHWYLKQHLLFPPEQILNFSWHHLLTRLPTIKFDLVTKHSILSYNYFLSTQCNCSSGILGIIDGKTIHLTNLQKAIIPPPNSGLQLHFQSPINKIWLLDNSILIVFDANNTFTVFNCKNESPVKLGLVTLTGINLVSSLFKVMLEENNQVLKIISNNNNAAIIACESLSVELLVAQKEFVKKFDFNVNLREFNVELSLDDDSILHVNNLRFQETATSIFVCSNYLLLTVLRGSATRLFCLRLTQENFKVLTSQNTLDSFYSRSIEQGSKIVGVSKDNHVILKLPRGNFETINCRIISIDVLEEKLTLLKWEEAILLIRANKLNANLLIDLNPERFCDNIEGFVKAAKTSTVLGNLCLEFSKENCLQHLYSNCVKVNTSTDKLEIFLKVLKFLQKDFVKYLNVIVLLNLRFFGLKPALISVFNLYSQSQTDKALALCKKALNQILLYSNETKLYREALQVYNIDFAKFVANCCNMDPASFEPTLNNLSQLPEVQRRHALNVQAKKFKEAVKYLLVDNSSDKTEVRTFVECLNLQEYAYQNISSSCFEDITKAYAEDLSHKGQHNEAGLVLKRGHYWEDALMEFSCARNVPQFFYCLNKVNFEQPHKEYLVETLVKELHKDGRTIEAAQLLETYLNNVDLALEWLLERNKLAEAIVLASKHQKQDFLDNQLRPKVVENQSNASARLQEIHKDITTYSERLNKIRQDKLLKHHQRLGGDFVDDLYAESDTSSMSGKSFISSSTRRNRRKEEHRKISLRPNGVYEDIAIMRHLHILMSEVVNLTSSVVELCSLGEDFEASKQLYLDLCKIYDSSQEKTKDIWSGPQSLCGDDQKIVMENLQHLDEQFKTVPAGLENKSWKMQLFGD